MRRVGILMATAIMQAVGASAATIATNSVISAEHSFPNERVQIVSGAFPPTVVQLIAGGEADHLQVYDDSILNMTGGGVTGSIATLHTARATIQGGTARNLTLKFDSVINLMEGTIDGSVDLFGSQGTPTFNMLGGHVMGGVHLQGPGHFNLHGGSVDRVAGIGVTDRSYIVNITGGSFLYLSLRNKAIAHWSGGEMRTPALHVYDESVLHIYGSGWRMDFDNRLNGTLLDGTPITRTWVDLEGNGKVVLHTVPESSTLALALTICFAIFLGLRRHGCQVGHRV